MPIKRTGKYQLSQWERTDKVLMEDFNTDNLNIENALAGLESSKAKQSDMTALQTEVSKKANQSDLAALQTTAGTKANQSDLTALKTEVSKKANQTDLTALQTTVSQKANQSDLAALKTTVTSVQSSMPKIAVGTYTGDGKENKTISVGFTPKAVLVISQYGQVFTLDGGTYNKHYGGLAVTGSSVLSSMAYSGTRKVVAEITTNGFIVHYATTASGHVNALSNTSGAVFHYIAFG